MKPKRITKKQVTEAENRFYRERQRWGDRNLATVRAEIDWHELRDAYFEQQKLKS